jgi:hypothetical protein
VSTLILILWALVGAGLVLTCLIAAINRWSPNRVFRLAGLTVAWAVSVFPVLLAAVALVP